MSRKPNSFTSPAQLNTGGPSICKVRLADTQALNHQHVTRFSWDTGRGSRLNPMLLCCEQGIMQLFRQGGLQVTHTSSQLTQAPSCIWFPCVAHLMSMQQPLRKPEGGLTHAFGHLAAGPIRAASPQATNDCSRTHRAAQEAGDRSCGCSTPSHCCEGGTCHGCQRRCRQAACMCPQPSVGLRQVCAASKGLRMPLLVQVRCSRMYTNFGGLVLQGYAWAGCALLKRLCLAGKPWFLAGSPHASAAICRTAW